MNYRKGTIITVLLSLLLSTVFAGGVLHNWNQSADYIRTFSRNASTDIDAAFYNPAGITSFQKGLYFAFHNQTIKQPRKIVNEYPNLNDDTYEGDMLAPVFPNFYFAWVTGDVAISGGFLPVGGGGSAEYETGLPSFEMPVSDIPVALAGAGVTDYSVDLHFEGSSVFLAGQLNVATKLNDNWSIFIGGRYVDANYTYEGHLKDIMINPAGGDMILATDYFFGSAASLYSTADDLNAAITAGMVTADTPFTDAEGLATLQALGFDTTDLTYGMAAAYFGGAGDSMTANGNAIPEIYVDTEQHGTGFTGMIGCAYQDETINFGFRHEFLTKLALTNDTEIDGSGMFTDGEKRNKDLPSVTTGGLGYWFSDELYGSVSLNYYHHGEVDWDGRENHVEDGYGLGFGVEYQLTDPLLISCGYLHTDAGTEKEAQSDLDQSLDSNSIGGGFRYQLQEGLSLSIGASYTKYVDFDNEIIHTTSTGIEIPMDETYSKESIVFSFGFEYTL